MALESLQQQFKTLRLSETAEYLPDLIRQAELEDWTYRGFLKELASYELKKREEKQIERHLKWAAFPAHTTLEMYQLKEQQTLSQKQMNQLSELTWIDQLYNLVLLGPAGVGKTHLATALGIEAIYQGYKVMFIPMEELIRTLKAEEITRKAQIKMKRIREANLVIIDDLMFMAMDAREANLFFHLINELHDKASIILTSNKGPSDWGDLLGDQGITTAILDRILHRVEVIQFREEDSYRMKNRTSIFKEESVQN
ncbi:IS21-like element helper ATPase IstB [Texcoconibacillus texcoconensis]|uniref:DNA replication protein DnaC n=1 Tax=Texcoconibacillus texcoconensis TaxID=1095777 RepID=A0A840QV43_9BACI|nr:IS21-like element helper ATPase IstB [Texcoconibacillus texcoconensis]MBB5175139.1 DNA replication protein DnaC [Texcoconibacillus texcoconensis]